MREAGLQHRIVSMSPFRCRTWPLHERAEEHITQDSCREEIASFVKYGQLVPVLGRLLSKDPAYDIEIICGARRLFIARHLNVSLRVELRELTDREAIASMHIENRHRKDISSYERGLAYARWLRDGYFNSQHDLASALGISAAQVSKLLKIARLPPVILSAFGSAAHIREGWGLEISTALEDPERRDRIVRRARELAREPTRLPAQEVCRQLLSAPCSGRRPTIGSGDKVVRSVSGTPLFRIRYARGAVMLLFPTAQVSARCLKEIIRAASSVVQQQSVEQPAATEERRTHRVCGALKQDTGRVLAAHGSAPDAQG